MEKAPALDPMPLYESCMVAFYRGAPAPGAPVVPTPLITPRQCAVCFISTRETVFLNWVPAKTSCLTSWTKEYQGYLIEV